MKSTMSLLGLIFIVVGIAVLVYQGFSYTKHENIAQIGDLKITADTEQVVKLSPVVGVLSIVAGIVLVVVGRRS